MLLTIYFNEELHLTNTSDEEKILQSLLNICVTEKYLSLIHDVLMSSINQNFKISAIN